MSNVVELRDPDRVSAEACEWLARIERGLTQQERAELQEWFSADRRHAPELIEIAGYWDKMGSLSQLAELFPRAASEPRHGRSRLWAVAACALIGLLATLVALNDGTGVHRVSTPAPTPTRIDRQVYETAIGEHSTIRLSDGSELTLNTNSRVLAELDGQERRLRLERGEVFVKVAPDPLRPLSVRAGDRVVRAIGTAFNVAITERERVEVIVTEGKVLIGIVKPPASPVAQSAAADGVLVAAGQRALLGEEEQKPVEVIASGDIDVKLSWRDGNLVFRGEPLVQALSEIARYTRVEFIIKDEKLKTVRVAGLFKAGDVDGLLRTLHDNFNITYERVDGEKIVLKGE